MLLNTNMRIYSQITTITADVLYIHASHAHAGTLRQLQLHTLHAMLLKLCSTSPCGSMFEHMHPFVAYVTHPSGFTLVFNSLLSV